MPTKQADEKQICPTCHQTVNYRKVPLTKGQVGALLKIGLWLDRENRTSFRLFEVGDLLTKTQYATLNEVKKFIPHIVSGQAGSYVINRTRLKEMFSGAQICIEYTVDPVMDTITQSRFGTLRDAKNIKDFISDNDAYVVKYVGRNDVDYQAVSLFDERTKGYGKAVSWLND